MFFYFQWQWNSRLIFLVLFVDWRQKNAICDSSEAYGPNMQMRHCLLKNVIISRTVVDMLESKGFYRGKFGFFSLHKPENTSDVWGLVGGSLKLYPVLEPVWAVLGGEPSSGRRAVTADIAPSRPPDKVLAGRARRPCQAERGKPLKLNLSDNKSDRFDRQFWKFKWKTLMALRSFSTRGLGVELKNQWWSFCAWTRWPWF